MKNKIYFLAALTGFFFSASLEAQSQCSINSVTITPSGLTINVTASCSGASVPYTTWSWGDATTPGTQLTMSHTYAAAGTYSVCLAYIDLMDTTCQDFDCQQVMVSPSGIAATEPGIADVRCFPNPFGNSLNAGISLTKASETTVTVYDITGKQTAIVFSGLLAAGMHNLSWSPENLADGIYFLRVQTESGVITKKTEHHRQ